MDAEKLNDLKLTRNKAIRKAEEEAYKYFQECELGDERNKAGEIYENLRIAARIY